MALVTIVNINIIEKKQIEQFTLSAQCRKKGDKKHHYNFLFPTFTLSTQ